MQHPGQLSGSDSRCGPGASKRQWAVPRRIVPVEGGPELGPHSLQDPAEGPQSGAKQRCCQGVERWWGKWLLMDW